MKFNNFLFLLIFITSVFRFHAHVTLNPNSSSLLTGIQIPHNFNPDSSSSSLDCDFTSPENSQTLTKPSVKLHLKRRSPGSFIDSAVNDLTRIQTLHKRILEKKTRNSVKNPKKTDHHHTKTIKPKQEVEAQPPQPAETYAGKLMGTLKSGVTLGSGDSNTTGDFATETFTVNLTTNVDGRKMRHQEVKVENVMFGCGHWNRGLFHGAAGLLGLGRGPLSFASQLQSLYDHSFSYCLVDRNSNSSVSSKLIFGEDKDLLKHPELNFTSLIGGNEAPVDVFYYVHVKSVVVAGKVLDIPEKTWDLTADGYGGTIIDSGTTLSYFADPAYNIIKKSFMENIKRFPLVDDFPILEPCYNVSGIPDYKNDLPSFGIVFNDGAVWNFPVENYFIKLEPEEIVCLAVLGTPQSALSIIGNYQQQNFHIMYDTKKSRLGYAPTRCADV
ncbi:putative nepenthesin [Helianthus annuus]|nr:putative nepenthesin [Helianthus annuus]